MDLVQDRYNQVVTLKDGRSLGYSEFGDPEGKPVFYFHGYIGGRLEPKIGLLFDKEINCRYISIDRPGIGLSSFKDNRKILDWPDDVIELADFLGIDKFTVVGVSGGGPYAAACAYKIPDRLYKVGIVAGMGPYKESKKFMKGPNKILFRLFRILPFFLTLLLSITKRQVNSKNQEKMKRKIRKAYEKGRGVPEPDLKIYRHPDFADFFLDHMKDIFQQGIKGAYLDGILFIKQWGFELRDIPETLPVFLWQGALDKNVSLEIGQYISSQIPNCTATYYPEDAHLSVEVNHFEEILEVLTT